MRSVKAKVVELRCCNENFTIYFTHALTYFILNFNRKISLNRNQRLLTINASLIRLIVGMFQTEDERTDGMTYRRGCSYKTIISGIL